jgi:hypothetical protein
MFSSSRGFSKPAFIAWAIINLAAGIWEVYAYLNRAQLKLENETVWDKMAEGKINLSNFWIEGWSEYCKVDSRYTREFFAGGYVWWFELLNAFLAVVFIFALAFGYSKIIKNILIIAIINCLGYFATLAIETWKCRLDNRFSKWWQYPIYYLISGIWVLGPWCLYEIASLH